VKLNQTFFTLQGVLAMLTGGAGGASGGEGFNLGKLLNGLDE
jgi:hypothetical protein